MFRHSPLASSLNTRVAGGVDLHDQLAFTEVMAEGFADSAAAALQPKTELDPEYPESTVNSQVSTVLRPHTSVRVAFAGCRRRAGGPRGGPGAERRGPGVRVRIKFALPKAESPADAPDNDSPASRGSSLAYTNGAKHAVFSTTTRRKHQEGHRLHMQMAPNILCLTPRPPQTPRGSPLAIANYARHPVFRKRRHFRAELRGFGCSTRQRNDTPGTR